MQKILFFINSLGGGGAERVCVNLSNGFYKNGFDVTLLVLNLQNSIFHKNLNPHIKLENLNTLHARNSIFKLSKYLLKTKPQTIFVFNYQLAVILVILRKILPLNYKIIARNINTLSILHSSETSFWHKYIVNFFTKSFYKKVDLLISQSKGMRDDLIEFYGIDKNKIITINNPVSKKIEEIAKKRDIYLYSKKNELFFAGSLSKRKGVDYLLKAFALIHKKEPSLYLRIAGEGEERENLKKLATELKIDKNVIFENFIQDIEKYYLQAKATLLTSLYEGFPNVLIESITLGTPVVAFDCKSGPSEIIQEGVNGYLVKHLDYEAFAEAVLKLLKNDFDTDRIIQSSLRYSNEAILNRYLTVITDFICRFK